MIERVSKSGKWLQPRILRKIQNDGPLPTMIQFAILYADRFMPQLQ